MRYLALIVSTTFMYTAAYSQTVNKSGWRILAPEHIYVDMFKYRDGMHDPYLSPIDAQLSYGLGFNVDFDVLKYRGYGIYMKNLLHFDQSEKSGHIKHAGWQYEVGATLYRNNEIDRVSVFAQHHSRHVLEEIRDSHFPVYDRYGIRIDLYP